MEVTADVNDTVDSLQEVNFKENEHLSEQTKSYNVLESPAPATIPVINWSEQISCLRPPGFNAESYVGQSAHFNSESHFGHESLYANPPSQDHGDTVRELTLRNYKNPNLSVVGCHDGNEQFQLRKGLQDDSKEMLGKPRYWSIEDSPAVANHTDTGNFILPQISNQKHSLSSQFGQKFSKLCWHLSRGEKYIASDNVNINSPGPARDSDLQVSESQIFSATKALKQKGIEFKCRDDNKIQTYADKIGQRTGILQTAIASQKCGGKTDNISQSAIISKNLLGNHRKIISLRNFLKPRSKLNEVEKVHMFKLIVDLVGSLHSQGFILKHLWPSHFVILPSKQVKYVGPLIPQGQMEFTAGKTCPDMDCLETTLKRKRNPEERNSAETSSTKHQKMNEQFMFSNHTSVLKREGSKNFDAQASIDASCTCEVCGRMQINGTYKSQNFPVIIGLSSGGQNMISEVLKLEERWYASPEELSEGFCSSSSNIYGLGVLLFELFCHFETREAHYAAMLNLRHRILPPTLLSEHPREAGICLWMLHPDPSSRPKIRDILLCDVFSKDSELSTVEQLSATIDHELSEAELLAHFLFALKEQKEMQAAKLMEHVGYVEEDLEEIKRRHFSREQISEDRFSQQNTADISDSYACRKSLPLNLKSGYSIVNTDATTTTMKNFEQLESAYFSMRSKSEQLDISSAVRQDTDILKPQNQLCSVANDPSLDDESSKCRGSFFESLCKYVCYKKIEVRGSLRNMDVLNSSNVICSLSFDHNEDYFAAAGASKKIKVFEFDSLVNSTVDIHYPVVEMSSKSKLSCVCWNGYIRNYLASTDYDGVVQLWDASTGQGFHHFADHQKRAWSVDFSLQAPTTLASGSDDCTVKLWNIHEKNCIKSIKSVANVCCVQFSPHSSHLLAFGSADYRIYCYDLRNTRIPWCSLAGHRKTVSYMKFVDSDKIVSASTDNTLKLWDLKKTAATGLSTNACGMTMMGHTNEKNFVGLSVCDGYILCGSETNEVYAYHKNFPMPITSYKFGYMDPVTGHEIADDNGQFVSSVCWRRKSNMLLAANSSGCIKLLQMV
ncbi:hypothetical protein Cni_G09487 [Canna indica]|uniref:Ubiquitin ligase protein cop1 n=1 Tax=Canna indica TaxID=4628 RepID=A0AAQ3K2E7_9LILI|nr:hypothetical protein Cni_G09487 [Canna indica]